MNRANNVVKKNLVDDRIFILGSVAGQKPKSSTGLDDPRLFTGENKLHAIKDPGSCLWYLKYDMGGLPPRLKDQRFTSFGALRKYVADYYSKRNIEIKEVID